MAKMKNISTAPLLITLPNSPFRYRRELAPNQTVPISQEVYDELIYDTGCQTMIQEGALELLEIEGLQELPIEAKAAYLDLKGAKELLAKPPVELMEYLKTATPTEKDNIVEAAVTAAVADPTRVRLIKQYCGVDILSALRLKSE